MVYFNYLRKQVNNKFNEKRIKLNMAKNTEKTINAAALLEGNQTVDEKLEVNRVGILDDGVGSTAITRNNTVVENQFNREMVMNHYGADAKYEEKLQEELQKRRTHMGFDLMDEILTADGFLNQHPTTGSIYGIQGWTYMNNLRSFDDDLNDEYTKGGNDKLEIEVIKGYRNKLFGAPFQFLDSVDARFSEVNEYVGFEFLKNFLIHAPILHIFPGVPKYTGGEDNSGLAGLVFRWGKALGLSNRLNYDTMFGEAGYDWSVLKTEAEQTLFGIFFHSKLQKRMFGIKFKYEEYQRYVHLMLKSLAILLKLSDSLMSPKVDLTGGGRLYPDGTFVNSRNGKGQLFVKFTNYDIDDSGHVLWNNYRMIEDEITYSQETGQTIWESLTMAVDKFQEYKNELHEKSKAKIQGEKDSFWKWLKEKGYAIGDNATALGMAVSYGLDKLNERTQSVEFLVEPTRADESYTNNFSQSAIAGMVDSISDIGSEVAFITNTSALNSGGLTFLLQGAEKITASALEGMADASRHFAGNFVSNLLTGGLGAIQGNRFIYPKIYKGSESGTTHQFMILLQSPYGDIYNYFMNILVPLCHMYGLALPHLKTSNSSSAPFILRAFIPGLKTIEMGAITSLQVTKNPNSNRVTINGFPLDVDLSITITELYNILAISPTDDALSFFQNETLSDYLCNLAGVFPTSTRDKMMKAGFSQMIAEQFNLMQQIKNTTGDFALNFLQMLQ